MVKVKTELLGLLAVLGCQALPAATWCVGPSSCAFQSIGAAVSAAAAGDVINVQPGIYNESITIDKSVSLVGSGGGSTIINAIGSPNGIFVNGMTKAPDAGVSRVVISGFTVTNASFEGILVANANQVTIANNQVIGNDRALVVTTKLACPGLPAFETNESEDCGEGIHLMAVDHSIVAHNVVKNNAGGILISDETGSTHDNLIMANTVANNVYDCGITMASHAAYAPLKLKGPAGIHNNTVYGNTSTGNGTQAPGAGAGIGIFTPGPGNLNYGNVIVNNTVSGNGAAGIAMHNHAAPPKAPAPDLNDNMIVGNTFSGNGADTGDSATAGPVGINIHSVGAVTGLTIAGNTFGNEQIDVAINLPSADVMTQFNNLQGPTGVDNLGVSTINAAMNYWGCPAGPGTNSCAGVIGMVLDATFATTPF